MKRLRAVPVDAVTIWTPGYLNIDPLTFHELACELLRLDALGFVETLQIHREPWGDGETYIELIRFKVRQHPADDLSLE